MKKIFAGLALLSVAISAPALAYTDVQYKTCAFKLTKEADIPGGYVWARPGFRGSTTTPYLYAGTNYRLVRGLSAAGKNKYNAERKAEISIPANKESGQYPNTEKKLMASFCWKDGYAVTNPDPK